MLIDSHCHLDRLKLDNDQATVDDAIHAAHAAGVSNMLCVAIDLETLDDVLAIAERHSNVHASVGVHPLQKGNTAVTPEQLIALADHPKVVAIGETGLDYHYSNEKSLQQANFVSHLRAGHLCAKPVIIHTREAREDTIDILAQEISQEHVGVMHCFTESWEMAKQALDLGLYISFSGIVTFKNADELREVVKKVPLDRLLIETDSPYLAPVPHRGKSNQPLYLPHVANAVAGLKGIDLETLAETTSQNYAQLFGVKHLPGEVRDPVLA